MKHLLSVLNLTKNQILSYIAKAEKYKQQNMFYDTMKNRTLINIFFEPSTRTSCSFQTAMIKLGGNIINITDKYSSTEKGESLEDTIKTIANYGDIIAFRHPQKGSAQIAANVSTIPLINAGDGNGEHPTQALLDIFTIKTELMKFQIDITSAYREKNVVVTFMGDLKNSRTIHSLIHVLCLFHKMSFIFINPKGLEMPEEIISKLLDLHINFIERDTLENALKKTDVLYVTRIQKERFETKQEYNTIMLENDFIIDKNILQYAKEKMIIMHPLPRLNEIHTEVDTDPRAVYFEQVKNGIYMRMAILDTILNTNNSL
jgi:carbamoyl-phosphate synthase/aspartate carbamoyltransferase